MKKVMMLMMAVALAAATQAVTVSWDGTSTDITDLTANIQLTPGPGDTVWDTSGLIIDSPGTQADFKAAMDQVQQYHKIAQINAGFDRIYVGGGGNTAQLVDGVPKIDATSPFSQMIGFDTSAFADTDVLQSMAVTILNRNAGDTLSFRWFVQTATDAYVSGVVDTFTGTAGHSYTLADATAIPWFVFDPNANIGSAISDANSLRVLTNVDYAGVYATETWTSGTTNWRGVFVSKFSASTPEFKATVPDPADGEVVLDTPVLSWTAGDYANAHDVYFDTVNPPVAYMGRQTATSYDPNDPNLPNGVYYWRIDEVDDPNVAVGTDPNNVWEGDVWSFEIGDPGLARNPNPADGATGVVLAPTLSWTAGVGAISHDVYFGTSNPPPLVSDDQPGTTYVPGALIKGSTYYWAVDEYDGTNTYSGLVWSFSTIAAPTPVYWTGGDAGSDLWSSEANWDLGVPGVGSMAFIQANGPAVIDSTVEAVATGNWLRMGLPDTDPNTTDDSIALEMTGGSLTVQRIALGNGGPVIVNISGGTVTTSLNVNIGDQDNCDTTLNINGGTVNVGTTVSSKVNATTNFINLNGGVLTATGITLQPGDPNHLGTTLDLAGGTLILAGDDTVPVNNYIDSGRIVAYGGLGAVLVNYDAVADETTVTASPGPAVNAGSDQAISSLSTSVTATAWDPNGLPMTYLWTSDPAGVTFGTPTDLTTTVTLPDWGIYELTLTATNSNSLEGSGSVLVTAIDPGSASDPNAPDGATGVDVAPVLSWTPGVDAQTHNVWFGTDPEALTLVSEGQTEMTYAPGTLIKGRTYYWAVDEIDSGAVTHYGPVWSFTVIALGGTTNWTGGGGSNLWNVEANWDAGVPGVGTQAYITANGPAVIDSTVEAVATGNWCRWGIADPNVVVPTVLNMTGGSLAVQRLALGNQGPAIVNISDGTIDVSIALNVGDQSGGDTTLNISGGTVNVGDTLLMKGITESKIDLTGGVLTASTLTLDAPVDPNFSDTIDLAGGTLILAGDDTAAVNGYIDGGSIVGYGGTGSVLVNYDAVADETTVVGCPLVLDADVTNDCAVNIDDLRLVAQEWLFKTPTQAAWSFDMATDPVGTGDFDLVVRDGDPNNANYTMTNDTGTGTLNVTGLGTLLLDQQYAGTTGLFDKDVHYVIKSTNEYATDLWIFMATSKAPGRMSRVGISTMQNVAGTAQTVEIWDGLSRQQAGYVPAVSETGFNVNAYLTIDVNYDYDTDTYDYSITDGTIIRQGFGIPYTDEGDGNAGGFTLRSAAYLGGAGNAAPGSALIDQLDITIYGTSIGDSDADVQPDGSVDMLDFAAVAAEWLLDGGI